MRKVLFISYVAKNGQNGSPKIWTKQRTTNRSRKEGKQYAVAIQKMYKHLTRNAADNTSINTDNSTNTDKLTIDTSDIGDISLHSYVCLQLSDRSIANPQRGDKSSKEQWRDRYTKMINELIQNLKQLIKDQKIKMILNSNGDRKYEWKHTTNNGAELISVDEKFDAAILEIIDISSDSSEDILNEAIVFDNDIDDTTDNRPKHAHPMNKDTFDVIAKAHDEATDSDVMIMDDLDKEKIMNHVHGNKNTSNNGSTSNNETTSNNQTTSNNDIVDEFAQYLDKSPSICSDDENDDFNENRPLPRKRKKRKKKIFV